MALAVQRPVDLRLGDGVNRKTTIQRPAAILTNVPLSWRYPLSAYPSPFPMLESTWLVFESCVTLDGRPVEIEMRPGSMTNKRTSAPVSDNASTVPAISTTSVPAAPVWWNAGGQQ
ncbi:hypothetical protein ASPCADRAFT_210463 [Aspergillus carbonarius ITEM 5010]|uniref:Uncharacterized protein n=1 Tax=Aspergillus carbonarius (strain ITEM 5010) TaxID=602072 RepID=A0A1R3RC22_ASPC5|nr:hypothetical protein ASPCADRAFT_210463 [Aspergillus carbonarius ITEM 5010]